ncbi:MAG: hypothetical protein H7Y20_04475, partial [Bryobacteraceae bacterium]|nr:hypothetical protein [Bryobacteraceae bacterium]
MDWPGLIPIFHRWIRENRLPGTLIDVADYTHVPAGPGVLLIAHDAFYGVDNREGKPGFLYNRRTSDPSGVSDKIRNAYDSASSTAILLEAEMKSLKFDQNNFEISVNDRLAGPNSDITDSEVRPWVESLYKERFGSSPVIQRDLSDPRGLFRL